MDGLTPEQMEGLLYYTNGDQDVARAALDALFNEDANTQTPLPDVMRLLWRPEADLLVVKRRSGDPKPVGRTAEEITARRRYLRTQDQSRIGQKDRFPWNELSE